MSSLIVENLSENININKNILTVKELLKLINYEFNELYLDKFWNNIENDKWLYINNELLEYIGYSNIDIKKGKLSYTKLLFNNFKELYDYKLINSKEFHKFSKSFMKDLENNEINTHNKTKHLIVSPDCFKQSLMMLRTEKSKEIRKYYTELEKIFKFYLQYQNKYQELKNLETIKQLEESKKELDNKTNELESKDEELLQEKEKNKLILEFTINRNPMLKTEKVYAVTTRLYALQHIIKIGRTTTKLALRLNTYNTGKILEDKYQFIWTFDCVDSKAFEAFMFVILKTFKVDKSNEMYKIHFNLFLKIMNVACNDYLNSIDKINNFIVNEQDNYIDKLPIIHNILLKDDYEDNNYQEIKQEVKQEVKEIIDKKFKCHKCKYKTNELGDLKNHLNRQYPCDIIRERKKYVCHKCNLDCKKPMVLKEHLNRKNPCDNILECKKCKYVFKLLLNYNNHINRKISCI